MSRHSWFARNAQGPYVVTCVVVYHDDVEPALRPVLMSPCYTFADCGDMGPHSCCKVLVSLFV